MNGEPSRFILDTSVLTQAARSYYALDIVPTFWEVLARHALNSSVLSIDRVKDEIDRGKDDLKEWVNDQFHRSFATTNDAGVLTDYQRVIRWAVEQNQYTDAAKAEFARSDNADAWVVAYGVAKGCTVVTQEHLAKDAKAKIPLPNVCQAFAVRYKGVAGQTDMAEFVSLSDQRRMHMTLPPLSEQRAIAHILGALDDKIELNRRMSRTLEEIARALFTSWFVDFEPVRAKAEGRDPGLPKHIADLFPDSFEESELGEIPRGWRVGTLGDVAEHPRRGVEPREIGPATPHIALEHMPRRSVALSEWGVAEGLGSGKFVFKKGEILFGKLRPYFHKVGIAPVDGVCSTDIVVVAPRALHWFSFVLGVVSSDEFVEYANARSTGTKMPRTSWADMTRYQLVLPPEPVARSFSNLIQPSVNRMITGIHESRTLAALRDALLPKLIRGEIRAKDAERFLQEGIA